MIRNILLVAAGGAIGSTCRYLISTYFSRTSTAFPWPTLMVNLLGSLLIGLLVGLFNKEELSPEMKLLLVTGFCGGFTTFSTFANESYEMMKVGEVLLAAIYIGSSVAVGVIAVWLGMKLCSLW